MDDNYQEIKKNWWDRNWKWFVPTGCLSLLVLFGLFIAAIFFGATSMMKDSDSYKGAMTIVQNDKYMNKILGSPIENDGLVSGNISINNEVGNCDLQIPIKGPKGKATLFVVAEKKGEWKYREISVHVDATDEQIELISK
ncbi:Cytochrome oxidase complex assembly protein 1 [Flavobacterium aquidurense]|uniref:Cytochrome oxidase complex assembly protein 1 n=1 Tax=Flavobacterium frigidimaris TaxID=262320 RepID=A0ABX4BNN5_FLAFR|nr:cytochrome c oxidase assembly factor Coa1 family protein [Flavobacterium frigidimaris]OXA78252.1 hypothetical protein B0A65_13900 [Flavobacterium frigidimaris]SDY27694.1 Cytochrome oxidase complex assembly protein 1 [Flavobacterium aquidurense]